MQRLVTALAFFSSLVSLVVIAGGGLTLLAIENSGERGAGALLALGSAIAFAATAALVFARHSIFGEGIWRAAAILAAVLGAMPSAGLSFVAIRFAGLPFGSRMPMLDWTVLGVGVLFGVGAIAILALGHRRSLESGEVEEEDVPVVHMQQIRNAQQQLRSAFETDEASRVPDDYDDIRVRRV